MTTWTMEQVYSVGQIRAKCHLDRELEDRTGGEASSVARDKMAKRIIAMGRPLGVEIHAGDLEFVAETSAEVPWSVTVAARWNPSTNGVELRGGPRDGERWAVQKVGDPFFVEAIQSTPWLGDEEASEVALGVRRFTYELAGWNESERLWVYELTRQS